MFERVFAIFVLGEKKSRVELIHTKQLKSDKEKIRMLFCNSILIYSGVQKNRKL